jgi:hypothetical protein
LTRGLDAHQGVAALCVTQVTDPANRARNTAPSALTIFFAIGRPEPLQESTMFKSNVGGIDRALRIVIGIALIVMTLVGVIGVWGWIGVVPLLTAALGSCPLYSVLGMSTCPMKKA